MVAQPTKELSQSESQVSHLTYHNWQWWTHVQAIDNAIIVSQKDYCWMSRDQIFVHVTRFRFPLRRLFMGNHRQHFQLRLRYWSTVQFILCSVCSTLLKINIYMQHYCHKKGNSNYTYPENSICKANNIYNISCVHGNAAATCER
jgi:hypothetical protein